MKKHGPVRRRASHPTGSGPLHGPLPLLLVLLATCLLAAGPGDRAAAGAGAGAGAAAAGGAPRTFILDPARSSLEFTVQHPLKTVHVRAARLSGEVVGDPAAPERGGAGHVKVPVRALLSGSRNRDANMWRGLGFPEHEEIRMDARRIRVTPTGSPDRYDVEVSGVLTVRGVSRPLEVAGRGERKAEGLRFTGAFSVRMSDHGVERPSLLFMAVEDEVKVTVDLVFVLAHGSPTSP